MYKVKVFLKSGCHFILENEGFTCLLCLLETFHAHLDIVDTQFLCDRCKNETDKKND